MSQSDCRNGCRCRKARPNCRVSRARWDKPCGCGGYHYPHRVGSRLCYFDNKGAARASVPALNLLAYGPPPEEKAS